MQKLEGILQAVLFDVDGTLLKTLERQRDWLEDWAVQNDITITAWEKGDLFGFQAFYNHHCARQGGVQNVYDELGLPCKINDRTHPVWPAYEKFLADHQAQIYDGVLGMIRAIHRLGRLDDDPLRTRTLQLGLNTTNSSKGITKDLRRTGVLQYMDCRITSEVLQLLHGAGDGKSMQKPARPSVALSLATLNIDGALALHVGDTHADLLASHKVIRINPMHPETLLTVGAAWGYEGRESLERGALDSHGERVHFDYIIDKPLDLIPLVERMLKGEKPERNYTPRLITP